MTKRIVDSSIIMSEIYYICEKVNIDSIKNSLDICLDEISSFCDNSCINYSFCKQEFIDERNVLYKQLQEKECIVLVFIPTRFISERLIKQLKLLKKYSYRFMCVSDKEINIRLDFYEITLFCFALANSK